MASVLTRLRNKRSWLRRAGFAVLALLGVGILIYAWIPEPVAVEIAHAERGKLQVTVQEDGFSRVRERYTVKAPVNGSMERIGLEAGDGVQAGQVLTHIQPIAPPLLNERSETQAAARLESARAGLERAQTNVKTARLAAKLARQDLVRARALYQAAGISKQELDEAELEATSTARDLRAAGLSVKQARQEVAVARAELQRLGGSHHGQRVPVLSPVTGQVLTLERKSAGPLQAGQVLAVLGDTTSLEVVVDVLTREAVNIRPGDSARVFGWGGAALSARVVRIESGAFTRVSALGVEEQRVNVILSFTHNPAKPLPLGDRFRVDVSITVWEKRDVLKIPASGLFRRARQWAVFCVRAGEAELTPVEIGRRSDREVQIRDGLSPGDRVILYPSDRITDVTDVDISQ